MIFQYKPEVWVPVDGREKEKNTYSCSCNDSLGKYSGNDVKHYYLIFFFILFWGLSMRNWNRVCCWLLVWMRLTCGWEDLNLPEGHISFYLRNNPEVKQKCQEEADCPYKVSSSRLDCWLVNVYTFAVGKDKSVHLLI